MKPNNSKVQCSNRSKIARGLSDVQAVESRHVWSTVCGVGRGLSSIPLWKEAVSLTPKMSDFFISKRRMFVDCRPTCCTRQQVADARAGVASVLCVLL